VSVRLGRPARYPIYKAVTRNPDGAQRNPGTHIDLQPRSQPEPSVDEIIAALASGDIATAAEMLGSHIVASLNRDASRQK